MKTLRRLAEVAAFCMLARSHVRAQYFDWAVGFGDAGNSVETANNIFVDPAGNIYLQGQYSGSVDFDWEPNAFVLGANDLNVFVAKYTAEGSFLWAVRFGGAAGARVFPGALTVDSTGNVYVTGQFTQTVDFDPGPGVVNLTAAPNAADAYVTKLNASGALVWARRLGGSDFDAGHAIAVDGSGNVYTAGDFAGTSDFDPGAGVFNLTSGAGPAGGYVSKLDGGGNFVWAKAFVGTGGAYCYGMDLGPGPGGGLYLAGSFLGTIDFDPGVGVTNLTAAGDQDAFVAKLDATGALAWVRGFGGTQFDIAAAVAVDPSGVFVTGGFVGTADFDPGPGSLNLTSGGLQDGFVVKLDNSGALTWADQLGGAGSGYENPVGIDVDGSGNAHVSGTYQGTADFDPGPGTFLVSSTSGGGDDVFALGLGAGGSFLWAAPMGGSCLGHACQCCTQGDDRALGMTVDAAGNTYTVGYFRGIADFDPGATTFDLSSQGLADDMFVSKLSSTPISGTVPDGASEPGTMLTLGKGTGGIVVFRWGASCRTTDVKYELYEGVLGDFTSHVPFACNLSSTIFSHAVSIGDRYYLVVPTQLTVEGSYGVDSNGNERAASAAACRPQSFDACVP